MILVMRHSASQIVLADSSAAKPYRLKTAHVNRALLQLRAEDKMA